MAFINSPNMSLPIPSVGTEPGPNYAFDVNSCMTLIDQHDHSPGKGVQITPAGLNINTALNFQNTIPYNIGALTLIPQSSASSTSYTITAAPGSGTGINDLWYTDGTGTQIQITQNGIVKTTASTIPGESYAAGTFIWTQAQDSLPTTPANFDIGSITIRPIIASTTNGVTLKSSSTSDYDLTFMASLPTSQSFVTIDNFGSITTPAVYPLIASGIANGTITTTQISPTAGILGTQLADQTITATQIANNTITATQISTNAMIAPEQLIPNSGVYSSSSGSFTTSSSSATQVTNLIGITTGGAAVGTRPVLLYFQGGQIGITLSSGTATATFLIEVVVGITAHTVAIFTMEAIDANITAPCGALNCINFNNISGGQYRLQVSISGGASPVVYVTNVMMVAVQL